MDDLFDVMEKDGAAAEGPLSVSAFAARVKGILEGTLGRVVVQGELGKLMVHGNGHLYADLKDEGAVVNLVAWRSTLEKWKGPLPKMGDVVVVTGKVTSYAARSSYQIVVEKMEPAGLGALMQQLEALKQRLAAEGLFDAENKRPLPFLPRRIGIVTSPTGAVISDMIHRIGDRCPREIVLAPAAVQGAGAAEQVARAIEALNALPEAQAVDVIIVARGGGSFEDLMPFNSEMVVRAVAGSAVPVVSGVGHEPDFTLCDMAADVRAPTPSAAAELVVPVREDLIYTLQVMQRRMMQGVGMKVAREYERVEGLRRLLPDPQRVVLQAGQRLGEWEERLRRGGPLLVKNLGEKIDTMRRVLVAHDPQLPLERGYVYLMREGVMVKSAEAVAGAVEIHFKDGVRKGQLDA